MYLHIYFEKKHLLDSIKVCTQPFLNVDLHTISLYR